MNDIAVSLIQLLNNHDAIAQKVGERTYPYKAQPNTATPYVVYEEPSTTRDEILEGRNGYVRARFEFTVSDRTRGSVNTLGKAIVDALTDFRGEQAGVKIDSIRYIEGETYFDDESSLFRRREEFQVNYYEEIPEINQNEDDNDE